MCEQGAGEGIDSRLVDGYGLATPQVHSRRVLAAPVARAGPLTRLLREPPARIAVGWIPYT
eukprot:13702323-Alexandrium_andersonii.AAC.1